MFDVQSLNLFSSNDPGVLWSLFRKMLSTGENYYAEYGGVGALDVNVRTFARLYTEAFIYNTARHNKEQTEEPNSVKIASSVRVKVLAERFSLPALPHKHCVS